jgi:hypothetical protein
VDERRTTCAVTYVLPLNVCMIDLMAPNLVPEGAGVRPTCSTGEKPIRVSFFALLTCSRLPRVCPEPAAGAVGIRRRVRVESVSVSRQSKELTRLRDSCSNADCETETRSGLSGWISVEMGAGDCIRFGTDMPSAIKVERDCPETEVEREVGCNGPVWSKKLPPLLDTLNILAKRKR